MIKQPSTRSKEAFPWLYFGLTFGISWLIWIATAISGMQAPMMPIMAGAVTPSIVAFALALFDPDKERRRDFWKRLVDFKRIGIGWYGVIVFLFPTILVVVLILNNLFRFPPISLDSAMQMLRNPLQLVALFFFMFVGGALEEPGWRGYALDRLQARWGALTSSLVLGLIWAFWHLPLFFIKGSSQAEMGFGLDFWQFILGTTLLCVIFSWVYNNTQRSTLGSILIHWVHNASVTFIMQMGGTLPSQTLFLKNMVTLAVCIVVVAVWGAKTMTRQSQETEHIPSLSQFNARVRG